MAKNMNINESLLFDDEFNKWLAQSDKMYEDLNTQNAQAQIPQPSAQLQPVQSQPVIQQPQQQQQVQQPQQQQAQAPAFPQNLVDKFKTQTIKMLGDDPSSMDTTDLVRWLQTLKALMR